MAMANHVWRPVEIELTAEETYANPYTGVRVSATFEHESGVEYDVGGFWDGESTWRIRFAPPEPGQWSWEATAVPIDDGLAASGTVTVEEYDGDNPLRTHGFIEVADDDRAFQHADGTPFFWLGDTVWTASSRARPDEWEEYLEYRAEQGYNVVQMNALRQYDGSVPHERLPFGEEWDLSRPNPAFFQALDELVAMAADRGIVSALVALWFDFVPGVNLDWGVDDARHHVSVEQARNLGRYLGARYGSYGVVWLVSGDSEFTDTGFEVYDAAAEGITETAPHALCTAHQPGGQVTPPMVNETDWLDFHMYQSSHTTDVNRPARQARDHRALSPPRPVLNGEPCYEDLQVPDTGHLIDRELVRTAGWVSVLAGATAGLTYGASGLWQWHRTEDEFPGESFWGPAEGWNDALQFPSADDYARLRDIVTDHGLDDFEPLPDLLAESDPGDVAASLADAVLIYLRSGRQVSLTERLGVEAFVWVDPETGERATTEASQTDAGLTVGPPPFDGDALLLGEY